MRWIYLSPHLDDAALSCGGLIWDQCQAGEAVSVWTVCAGDPPVGTLSPLADSLHTRWRQGENAVQRRRGEDRRACARLGAIPVHFSLPDCIYRRDLRDGAALYASEESLFGELHPEEASLVETLTGVLAKWLPADARLVVPLALGGHVDHRLARASAEGLDLQRWYYADYPYLLDLRVGDQSAGLAAARNGLEAVTFPVSGGGLEAWQDSVAAYSSQLSTFWVDERAMRAALEDYHRRMDGVRLWHGPAPGERSGE